MQRQLTQLLKYGSIALVIGFGLMFPAIYFAPAYWLTAMWLWLAAAMVWVVGVVLEAFVK